MVVTLIGYRGSGKSSVAGPLANRLGWDSVDSDSVIEQRAGRTIREIFADHGEPEFRNIERKVIKELLAQNRLVIAAGGGAILDPGMREAMRTAGPVVWLRAPVEVLVGRIVTDGTSVDRRPALTDTSTEDEIRTVLSCREPLYREACTVDVTTGGRTIGDIVDELSVLLSPVLNGKDGP